MDTSLMILRVWISLALLPGIVLEIHLIMLHEMGWMFVREVCNSCWDVALIKRAPYYVNSICMYHWIHLLSCKKILGFKSYKTNPDVKMRESFKDDGTKYFEYVKLYVYDCIFLWFNHEKILRNEDENTLSQRILSFSAGSIHWWKDR